MLFLILNSPDVKLSDDAFGFWFVGSVEFVRPMRFMEGYNPVGGEVGYRHQCQRGEYVRKIPERVRDDSASTGKLTQRVDPQLAVYDLASHKDTVLTSGLVLNNELSTCGH